MKITIVVQQTFELEANTLSQAFNWLREGCFPSGEILLAVRDESGSDLTEQWRKLIEEMWD